MKSPQLNHNIFAGSITKFLLVKFTFVLLLKSHVLAVKITFLLLLKSHVLAVKITKLLLLKSHFLAVKITFIYVKITCF